MSWLRAPLIPKHVPPTTIIFLENNSEVMATSATHPESAASTTIIFLENTPDVMVSGALTRMQPARQPSSSHETP